MPGLFGRKKEPEFVLRVDRDSVAMGDDVESHAYEMVLPCGTSISEAVDLASPSVGAPGWSWIAVLGGTPVAVWSMDGGARLLVADAPFGPPRGEIDLFFRYFVQIDPEWLYWELRNGAAPDRRALEEAFAGHAARRREVADRAREASTTERLLGEECVAVLTRLGVVFDLHHDRLCRFDFVGTSWRIERLDTMTRVTMGGGHATGSFRPSSWAEKWLVAAIGARLRLMAGREPLPAFDLRPAAELTPQRYMWSITGPDTIQVSDGSGLLLYHFVAGRSLVEILTELDL